MDNNEIEQARKNFYTCGAKFFSWNSGKNTPNILLMLTKQIGELEVVLRKSSESSEKLASALNRITMTYVILTGVIAVATVAQVIVALRK